jgi:probable rRNA maturation factor
MSTSIHVEVDDGLDVPVGDLERVAASAVSEDERDDAELTVRIGGDELLQKLNREHRGLDEPTDVLSFPATDDGFPDPESDSVDGGYLGDIAISLAAAERNAELTGTPLDRELQHLVTHGVLHLLGYDHETEDDTAAMRAREVELLGEWVHAIWDAPPTH